MTSAPTALRPQRVLVIGAGPAADALHLPVLAALRDRGDIVLAVICDLQHERAAAARRKFGFLEDCGDAAAAIARADIHAVYVFAGAQQHYQFGMAALLGGKHLFVEKPVAPGYAQACEMAEMARARGLIAAGGLNRRFLRGLAEVRARAGTAAWRFAEAVLHKPVFTNPAPFGARTWLSANGIHCLDALLYMMGGLPELMTAHAGDVSASQPGAFSALMRWRDGAQGVFVCNNNAGTRREEYVFHAPDETCTVSATGLVVSRRGKPEITLKQAMESDGYAAEHDAFVHAMRSGAEPAHSVSSIAPSMFLAELIENGFNGRVQLPQPQLRRAARQAEIGREETILVVPSAELQAPLANLLPHRRFVSLQDVQRSAGDRPEVVAAILGRSSSALSGDLLAKLPGLKVVGVAALSLARHEPEALLARGIRLVNASSAYADSVAEFALALAILGRRRAFESHQIMRAGGWGTAFPVRGLGGILPGIARKLRPVIRAARVEPYFLDFWRAAAPWFGSMRQRPVGPRDLRGATAGLIGWGENARAFTDRLSKSGARILVYSEHASENEIRRGGAVPASLAEVLASDIVSLHRGLTPGTRHHLGSAELARLRPGSVFINIARGALVEPNALLARLKQGDIFACLDTFENEPLTGPDALRNLRNVFLTSHIAGGSADNYAAAAEEVVRKVAAYLDGECSRSISVERLRTMS